MNTIIFNFIIALIPIIGAILTSYIIPFIKIKINGQQIENAKILMREAVLAAEVLFKTTGSGNEKRDFVLKHISSIINKDKEIMTEEQLRVLLESIWYETLSNKKENS